MMKLTYVSNPWIIYRNLKSLPGK